MRPDIATVSHRFVLACCLVLAQWPLAAYTSDFKDPVTQELGISSAFGRWENGVVTYVYNPTGAPALFSDDTYFIGLLQDTMAEIEGVTGVTFLYQGVDPNVVIATITDNVVAVGWEDIGGAAGQAGPAVSGCTGQDQVIIGYCAYTDGTVRFNNNGAVVDWDDADPDLTARNFKQVAMHELLHLLGIGHSEQQQSIMYADPYNNLSHLRDDDVNALRSLYGEPDQFIPASIYVPPSAGASPLVDSYISLVNNITVEVATVDGTEPDSSIGLLWWVPDGHVDDLTVIAADPHGYYYSGRIDDRDCVTNPPGNICGKWASFASMPSIVTYPGLWTVYGIMNGELITTHTVNVTTSPTFNKAPDSYIVKSVTRGQAPVAAEIELTVTGDNEGDAVNASWHIPGVGPILLDSGNFPGSAGLSSQSISYTTPGDREVFVTVNDDWTRYGSGGSAAGPGFRNAYRIVIEATEHADDITTFVDVSGDAIPDVAGFSGTHTGAPQIAVYSGANGSVYKTISFINNLWRGIALGTVRDANQDGIANDPAVAMLVDHKTTQKIRVETRALANNAFLGSIQFLNENWRALDVVIVDDVNGDGNTSDTAVAVLAERISDGRIQLQLRNFSDGALISNVVYLNARWTGIAAAVVDRSAMAPAGTLPPLIGVIAQNATNDKRIMQSRVAGSGTFDRNIKFLGSAWNYHDLAVTQDANGDGTNNDPIWQVLATRDSDLVMRVQSMWVSTGAYVSNKVILNSTWRGLKFDSAPDIDGNLGQEMVFSVLRRSTGARRIHIKDYQSSSTTLNIAP